jgi:curved DNA-binding protein
MDHYQTLGVAKNATPDEIKKAYRKLASQHHPDKGGDTVMFQKIEEAYRILSDPEQRQQYDMPQPQGFSNFNGPGGFNFNVNGMDMGDIFNQMFGGQRSRPQKPMFRTTVAISLQQSYSGSQQVLNLQTQQGISSVTVNIPKGVDNGNQIRYDNLIDGASLIVEFRVHPDLKFDRQGSDLYTNFKISVLDLIVGTKVEFTTLSGKTFEVNVPPNTQPFMQLKIAGQGMPIPNTNRYGDQILLLKPFIPDKMDSRIIDSIKQFNNT